MPRTTISAERLEAFLREHGGFVRIADLRQQGIDRRRLYAMAADGAVERVGQGLYRSTDIELLPQDDLAGAAIAIPHGVICLVSALIYHELTDERQPFTIQMAVENKRWAPRISSPQMEVHYFSGKAFSAGIEEAQLDGVPVRIYNKEKTVADCLKYRHKLAPGVPQAALCAYLRLRQTNVDRLLHYARICRVEPLLRCYTEVLL